jgi:hypothetical protein
MIRWIILALLFWAFASATLAQQATTCATRPTNDNSNACASTNYVTNQITSQAPGVAPVQSVFSRTGSVTAQAGDYSITLLSPIAADTIVSNLTGSSTAPSAASVPNCATGLIYSTSTHTLGCASAFSISFPNQAVTGGTSGGVVYGPDTTHLSMSSALTTNGVVYGGGAGNPPSATSAGSLGQLLVGTAGAPTFKTPASYSSNAFSNPTGTNNTTGLMMGLGAQGASITPTFSGRVLLIYTGTLASNSGTAYSHTVYLYLGTGAAPSNGAALTGSLVNSQGLYFNSSVQMGISVVEVVTGLTVGTTYWLDIALKSGNSGATINSYYNSIQAIEF